MRLCLVEAENQDGGFVCPTSVALWAGFFDLLLPNTGSHHFDDYKRFLRNALAHRFQYLESLAGLIIHNIECNRAHNPSSLHETVLRYNIHAFVTVLTSCVEGVGSYWYRCDEQSNGTLVLIQSKISSTKWKKAIVERVTQFHRLSQADKDLFKIEVDWLWEQRNAVHLDSIQPNQVIDFHDFDNDCFKRAYIISRKIIQLAAFNLPPSTNMNEAL